MATSLKKQLFNIKQPIAFDNNYFAGYTSVTTQKFTPGKSLFERVTERYREKLKKLEEEGLTDLAYLWIRDGGNDIYVTAQMRKRNSITQQKLGFISLEVSSELLPIETELLTFYDYISDDDCGNSIYYVPEDIKLFPFSDGS